MGTSDRQIRQRLHADLVEAYGHDPGTLLLHELSVCQGEARIDIALINGSSNGYEIKSDQDGLDRLPGQIRVYNRVFETLTIVVGESRYRDAAALAPDWWGIKVAIECKPGEVRIEDVRQPVPNPNVDAFSLAQFLWRNELLDLLAFYAPDRKLRHLPRFKLWAYVANSVPVEELKTYVRDCLKKRSTWRPDALRTSNGDSY